MKKPEANFDTTYCTNKECDKKCFRHESNYKFKENENYWYMDYCSDFLERRYKNELQN